MSQAWFKQRLVGTYLGFASVRGRQLFQLCRAVTTNPEMGGMLCQEACARQLLPGLCDSSKTFVDVGAHIGSVIGDVRREHPTINVIAIEADPEKAAALNRRFKNTTVHSCALGESNGVFPFYVDIACPGYSSLKRRDDAGTTVREIAVQMRRLDDIIPTTIEVGLIKIDVEGAELSVLCGSGSVVERSRPTIFFESGPDAGVAAKFSLETLFDWFAARSYEVLVPDRLAHDGPSLTRDGFVESHFYPFRTLNYFAVPAEQRIAIRDSARKRLGIKV